VSAHEQSAFLELAIDEAVAGVRAGHGGPFGAVVVHAGQVIARAHNRVTSQRDPTAHAEVEAIRAACASLGRHELSGCDLYASCEPCPMCLGAVMWSRLDRVFFASTRQHAAAAGFDDAVFYEQLERTPGQRTPPMLHVATVDGTRSFDAWAAFPGRVSY
jgi:guanine deaminase